jgi:hypothetical protein
MVYNWFGEIPRLSNMPSETEHQHSFKPNCNDGSLTACLTVRGVTEIGNGQMSPKWASIYCNVTGTYIDATAAQSLWEATYPAQQSK